MHAKLVSLAALLLAAAAFLLVGCSESTDSPTAGTLTDEQALAELFAAEEFESLDAWNGGDELGGGNLDEPIEPLHWFRMGRPQLVNVRVEIRGDSFATIARTGSINGMIRLLTVENDSIRVFFDKPMHNRTMRIAHAMRVGRGDDPRRNWRIVGVTPEVLHSAEPNPHTVWPLRVELLRNTNEGLRPVVDITEPLRFFMPPDRIPVFVPDEQIIVRVTANRRDGVVGVLHPQVFRHDPHPRLPLRDDGVEPDETAHDGVFTGAFRVAPEHNLQLTAIDLIDHGTLFDTERPYDSGGWAIPFMVGRPN